MFDSIGWGEILVVALAALFIFGPERLPSLAKDASRGLRRVRATIKDLRGQVDDVLGEDLAELRDLDLRRYHPRTFIRDQLFGDEDDDYPLRAPGPEAVARPRDRATPPPYDYDAT